MLCLFLRRGLEGSSGTSQATFCPTPAPAIPSHELGLYGSLCCTPGVLFPWLQFSWLFRGRWLYWGGLELAALVPRPVAPVGPRFCPLGELRGFFRRYHNVTAQFTLLCRLFHYVCELPPRCAVVGKKNVCQNLYYDKQIQSNNFQYRIYILIKLF